jgi:hypothetical protein
MRGCCRRGRGKQMRTDAPSEAFALDSLPSSARAAVFRLSPPSDRLRLAESPLFSFLGPRSANRVALPGRRWLSSLDGEERTTTYRKLQGKVRGGSGRSSICGSVKLFLRLKFVRNGSVFKHYGVPQPSSARSRSRVVRETTGAPRHQGRGRASADRPLAMRGRPRCSRRLLSGLAACEEKQRQGSKARCAGLSVGRRESR